MARPVSNPGPLTYESDALLTALHGPASLKERISSVDGQILYLRVDFRALDKKKYFLIIRDNIGELWLKTCCDPSFELSRRDSSDEGLQHMVSLRNKKNYSKLSSNTLCYLELWTCIEK